MSDATPIAPEFSAAVDPAAAAWLARFEGAPDAALDDLLMGKVWLGGYAAAGVSQALPQFLPLDQVETLDGALQRWLSVQLKRVVLPEGASAKQYAQTLADAFGLMQALSMPRAQGWCREHVRSLWAWLQVQPHFPSREPRATLLRALALNQPNRDLLGFWMSLCRLGHKPWVQLAMFGLRRLPRDDDGTPESSLPMALVHGLLDYGQTLARGATDPGKKKDWQAELDFLAAVYPMSKGAWAARFREALAARKQDAVRTVRNWLDERLPAANQPAPHSSARGKPLEPPHWDNDVQPLLNEFDARPAQVRPQLLARMDHHLSYARNAGDNYFLVRSYCRVAEFLLKPPRYHDAAVRDAQWALDLGQTAANWAPGDHQSWSVVARSLDALDDWARARAVFWYARRRFPHNPQAHNQLGHALAMRGMVAQGETVYRAAIRRFPDDPVCWADLGHTLRVAGRGEDALAVYQEAQQKPRFHRNPTICRALAGLLIDLGRVDDARAALEWAEQVSPADDRNLRVLADLRKRFGALARGESMALKQPRPRGEVAPGDWAVLESATGFALRGVDDLSLSTLWRQSGNFDAANKALDRAGEVLGADARWVAESALLLADLQGWGAARERFANAVAQRPGDGVLAVHLQRARAFSGEVPDWQSLRGRFEDLAPMIRVLQDAAAKMPPDLAAKTEDLDDDALQARWVYETADQPDLAELVQEDFLAARHIAVF